MNRQFDKDCKFLGKKNCNCKEQPNHWCDYNDFLHRPDRYGLYSHCRYYQAKIDIKKHEYRKQVFCECAHEMIKISYGKSDHIKTYLTKIKRIGIGYYCPICNTIKFEPEFEKVKIISNN